MVSVVALTAPEEFVPPAVVDAVAATDPVAMVDAVSATDPVATVDAVAATDPDTA